MLNPDYHFLPIKPNDKVVNETMARSVRPQTAPQSHKNFSKIVEKESDLTSDSEERVETTEEKDESPSLFDLLAKKGSVTNKPIRANHFNQNTLTHLPEAELEDDTFISENGSTTFPLEETESPLLQNEQLAENLDPHSTLIEQPHTTIQHPAEKGLENAAEHFPLQQFPPTTHHTFIPQDKGLHKGRLNRPDILFLDTDATVVNSKDEHKLLSATDSRFIPERGDLSYITPPIQPVFSNQEGSVSSQTSSTLPVRSIQDIVDQIVKTIQTIDNQGKTDTVVTLQHPPIFQGAQIILTSYETAPNEFNIAFTNLATQAKAFLDQQLSKDSLTLALENKGFVIHMITTTTLHEVPSTLAFNENDNRQYSQDEQRQRRQNQGNQQFEEE